MSHLFLAFRPITVIAVQAPRAPMASSFGLSPASLPPSATATSLTTVCVPLVISCLYLCPETRVTETDAMLISPFTKGVDSMSTPSSSGLLLLRVGLDLSETLAHGLVEQPQYGDAAELLVLGGDDVDG